MEDPTVHSDSEPDSPEPVLKHKKRPVPVQGVSRQLSPARDKSPVAQERPPMKPAKLPKPEPRKLALPCKVTEPPTKIAEPPPKVAEPPSKAAEPRKVEEPGKVVETMSLISKLGLIIDGANN